MNAIALHPIRRIQSGGEFGRRKPSQIRDRSKLFVLRINPINPALVLASAGIELRQAVGWNPARMLDDEPIHIYNPDRAIRAGAHLHWTKPIIARGKKFRLLLVLRSNRAQDEPVGFEEHAMDKVMDGFANE